MAIPPNRASTKTKRRINEQILLTLSDLGETLASNYLYATIKLSECFYYNQKFIDKLPQLSYFIIVGVKHFV